MLLGRLECLAGCSSSGEGSWKRWVQKRVLSEERLWLTSHRLLHFQGGTLYPTCRTSPTQVFRNLHCSYSGEICESRTLMAHNKRMPTMLEPWSWFECLSSLAWVSVFPLVPWSGTQCLSQCSGAHTWIIFPHPRMQVKGLEQVPTGESVVSSNCQQ